MPSIDRIVHIGGGILAFLPSFVKDFFAQDLGLYHIRWRLSSIFAQKIVLDTHQTIDYAT